MHAPPAGWRSLPSSARCRRVRGGDGGEGLPRASLLSHAPRRRRRRRGQTAAAAFFFHRQLLDSKPFRCFCVNQGPLISPIGCFHGLVCFYQNNARVRWGLCCCRRHHHRRLPACRSAQRQPQPTQGLRRRIGPGRGRKEGAVAAAQQEREGRGRGEFRRLNWVVGWGVRRPPLCVGPAKSISSCKNSIVWGCCPTLCVWGGVRLRF